MANLSDKVTPSGVLTPTGNGSGLTSLTSAALTGDLPAISGAALTSLTSANLTGALPAISGDALTSLTSAALTGALPAISGAALTVIFTAKSWVNIAGASTPTIRGSGGVSGIVDIASGRYQVNYSASLANANYAAPMNAHTNNTNGTRINGSYNYTTSSCYLNATSDARAGSNSSYYSVVVVSS